MIRRCDVVVSIRFQASDAVLLLELEVIYESCEEVSLEGHFLQSWEKTRLSHLRHGFLVRCTHVGVATDVLDSNTRLGVRVQDLLNEVLALRREELGHLVIGSHNLLVQIRCLGVLEGEVASDHGVENDTTRPNVRLQTVISLPGDHLGRCIAWRATRCLQRLILLVHVGKTEVDDLERVVVVQQKVLRL